MHVGRKHSALATGQLLCNLRLRVRGWRTHYHTHPTTHLLCATNRRSAPQKARVPSAQEKPCRQPLRGAEEQSYSAQQGEGQAAWHHEYTSFHRATPDLFLRHLCLWYRNQQDRHLTDKQVQFQALPTNTELTLRSAVAGFINTQKKKPLSASSLAVNLTEAFSVMCCKLEKLAPYVSVK